MRTTTLLRTLTLITSLALAASASAQGSMPAPAQGGVPTMSKDEITALAKVQVAITAVHDSMNAQLAQARNKKAEVQDELHKQVLAQIAEVLHHNGMTEEEFKRKTFAVSSDSAARKIFDTAIAQITGAPLPGQAPAAAPPAFTNLPPGQVGVHIGHVVNGFNDTPQGKGLLPTAMAEARTAAQHAALAARQTSNLDAMKLHAGHVINAIDPTIVPMGPGLGYGVKKAGLGVATHIELAAKAEGASPAVVTHSMHIATAARSTIARADQILAIAKKIQESTSATDAAALVSQLVPLTEQLTAGVDANSDGRITWEMGEGGLQQAQEHVTLMLGSGK